MKISYLTLIILLFFKSINTISASAWSPATGKFKHSGSISTVDHRSRKQQHYKTARYLKIQQRIHQLTQHQQKILKNQQKLIAKYGKLVKSQDKYMRATAKLAKITEELSALKSHSQMLSSYHDKNLFLATLEYGISDVVSCGISWVNQNNAVSLENNESLYNNKTSIVEVFSKIQLWTKDKLRLIIQPKIYTNQSNYKKRQELLSEFSIIIGTILARGTKETLFDLGIALSNGVSANAKGKKYFSLFISEGIKFDNGIMLTNFSKYYLRHNYGPVYSRTLYDQVAIAKQVTFNDQLKANNFTLQLGYFWDRSLRYNDYAISGAIFSLWFEI